LGPVGVGDPAVVVLCETISYPLRVFLLSASGQSTVPSAVVVESKTATPTDATAIATTATAPPRLTAPGWGCHCAARHGTPHHVDHPRAKSWTRNCIFSPHAALHRQPSFKPAAWLPGLSRAASQLARRERLDLTAPPLRLSGGSPDSRSGDATEAHRCNAKQALALHAATSASICFACRAGCNDASVGHRPRASAKSLIRSMNQLSANVRCARCVRFPLNVLFAQPVSCRD